jgi:hypothetical protein
MAEAPFGRASVVDRILQSRSLASSTPAAIGFPMTDFPRKQLFARSALHASCSF